MDNNLLEYDDTNPISIENYAKMLIGKTFSEVLLKNKYFDFSSSEITEYGNVHENKNRKGGLGELIEECYFHYECNNDSNPDFEKAGVELKVTPYKINKNGSLSAKERLIITMIDYFSVINEEFENSHFWSKGKLILLIYYLYEKHIDNRLNYSIDYVKLFSPPEQDIKIIKHDYEVIINKIKIGKAHELSESDTLYLGAAPKAATSADKRKQPFNSELAKPRAFAYKNSYMTFVLNNYIVPNVTTYESIAKNDIFDDFENFVVNKIDNYSNYSIEDLCKIFNVVYSKKPKNLEAMLVYRILGIKGNQAEEFIKANIVIKTIRLQSNNKIVESMSFPTFKFKELINEEWEDSTFCNYLRETRFMFVVYKIDNNNILRLKGCQFWNIPNKDLNEEVFSVWTKTKQVLLEGLKINIKNGKFYSNFPKIKDNAVCHVRPHGRDSKDTYDLPDGRKFPKQCFWLNNNYILSQLHQKFFD